MTTYTYEQVIDILADEKLSILYRPKFASKLSVTAAILLQQIYFRWKNNDRQPFYKFKGECRGHKAYKEGDSWCEELGFSKREFDTAIRRIGIKITKKDWNSYQDWDNAPKYLVLYYTDINRMTWYILNEKVFSKFLSEIYVKHKTAFTGKAQNRIYRKSTKPHLPEKHKTAFTSYTDTNTENKQKEQQRSCASAQISTKNEKQISSIGETEPTEEGLLENGVRKRTIRGRDETIEKRKRVKEGKWLDEKTFNKLKRERSKDENTVRDAGVQKSTVKPVASWNAKDWRLWLGEKFERQVGVASMELSGGGKNIARMHSRIKRFTDTMTEVSGYRQEDVKSYFDWWFDIKWEQIKKRDKGDMPSLTFSFMTAPSFVAEWQSVRGSVEERAREKHIANDYFATAGNGVRS